MKRIIPCTLGSAAALLMTACHVTTAADHLANGDRFVRDRKFAEAVLEYGAVVQAQPRHGDAHFRLAQAYEHLRDYGHASQEYIAASELLPEQVEVQVKGASMFLLGRHFDEARICAERALRLNPRHVVAQVLHAHAMAGLKQTGAALASIQKAIALDPTRGQTYTELGVFQLANGSPEQAEANLTRAAAASTTQAQPHLTLASLYWAQGRFPEAEAALKRGVEVEPGNVTASRALATFYLGNGRAAEAEAQLRHIAQQTGESSAKLALADYYITLDRLDDARRLLTEVAGSPDGYAEAQSRLAAIEYGAGRTEQAHARIDETLGREPKSARALQTRATFLMIEGKAAEALTQLRAAVDADQRSIQAHFALATAYASQQEPEKAEQEFSEVLRLDPSSVAARMELARLHLALGDLDLANDLAQQAAGNRPSPDTALLLARTLMAKGQVSRAEAVLRPLLDAGTTRADILSVSGAAHAGRGDSDIARELFTRAAATDPAAAEPIEGLVALDLRAGNLGRARTTVEDRLRARPRDSRLLVLAARTYGAAKDVDRMIASLRAAIDADPANTVAYALLGQVYASQGKLPDALREFEELARRDPRSIAVQTMLGRLLEALGRPADAEARYQRVLELSPRAPVASNNLAWMYAEQGRNLDIALQLAQVAKDGLPEQPDVNDTLAWVYYRKDLPQMALAPLRISVEREPANAVFQYHLGLVYLKTGDIDLARQALSAAVKLDPRFPGATEAREALALLQ